MSDLVFLTKVPDEVLQLLAGAEDCNTVGVNCNQITGFGIAGLFSALACSDLECSESAELDDLLFLETGLDFLEELIDDLVDGLRHYMASRHIDRVEKLVGEQLKNFVLPSDLDRDTIVYPKIDRDKCIGCGRCYTSCSDGGHQAITFDTTTRQPHIVGTKCVGCHLCRLVCPTGAIDLTKRIEKKEHRQ